MTMLIVIMMMRMVTVNVTADGTVEYKHENADVYALMKRKKERISIMKGRTEENEDQGNAKQEQVKIMRAVTHERHISIKHQSSNHK